MSHIPQSSEYWILMVGHAGCCHDPLNDTSVQQWLCGLMKSRWTNGKGSDIKAGSPACAKFQPEVRP